jgi:predicted dehydrogenase
MPVEGTLRLAVIGAGSVTELRHIPAVAAVDGCEIAHLVDLDAGRAERLARAHGIAGHGSELERALESADAAVIATPPSSHAAIAVACLRRGVHVLCEKPLAPTREEGERIADAARESGVLLSVAMVRRVGGSVRLAKLLLERGVLGRLERIEAEEGGAFEWPLRTGHLFESRSEGGVLRDLGTHLIDLCLWLAGGRELRATAYEDDSWGGPEANAAVEFGIETPGGTVPARVEASFTRALANEVRIRGEAGELVARTSGGVTADLRLEGAPPVELRLADETPGPRVADFARQLRAFRDAIRAGSGPPVPVDEALPTLGLIDACAGRSERRVRLWEAPPEPGSAPVANGTG